MIDRTKFKFPGYQDGTHSLDVPPQVPMSSHIESGSTRFNRQSQASCPHYHWPRVIMASLLSNLVLRPYFNF
jgi:hypothetical protein